jgi:hypothetical protein
MELGNFKESNGYIGEDYNKFNVHYVGSSDDRIIFCWELNIFERIILLFTGHVWQQSLLNGGELQKTAITIDKPFMVTGSD